MQLIQPFFLVALHMFRVESLLVLAKVLMLIVLRKHLLAAQPAVNINILLLQQKCLRIIILHLQIVRAATLTLALPPVQVRIPIHIIMVNIVHHMMVIVVLHHYLKHTQLHQPVPTLIALPLNPQEHIRIPLR